MGRFEYEITKYPADKFAQLVYFCSIEGECSIDQLPSDQMAILGDILSERGSEGWELVQVFFGTGGVVAIWKKPI